LATIEKARASSASGPNGSLSSYCCNSVNSPDGRPATYSSDHPV
jgi:hypothetical protein